MKNKRMTRRVEVNFPIVIELDQHRVEGTVKEVGEGGMRIECRAELKPAVTVAFILSMSTDEPTMKLKGEILYKYPAPPDTELFEYGVRFIEMDEGTKESLANILRVITLRQRYAPKRSDMIKDD